MFIGSGLTVVVGSSLVAGPLSGVCMGVPIEVNSEDDVEGVVDTQSSKTACSGEAGFGVVSVKFRCGGCAQFLYRDLEFRSHMG